jgi:hypothetical protein
MEFMTWQAMQGNGVGIGIAQEAIPLGLQIRGDRPLAQIEFAEEVTLAIVPLNAGRQTAGIFLQK